MTPHTVVNLNQREGMNDPRRNVPLPFLQGRRFPIIYLDLQNAWLEVLGQRLEA